MCLTLEVAGLVFNPESTRQINAVFDASCFHGGYTGNRIGRSQNVSNPAKPAKLVDASCFKQGINIRTIACPCKIEEKAHAHGFSQATVNQVPREPMLLIAALVEVNPAEKQREITDQ